MNTEKMNMNQKVPAGVSFHTVKLKHLTVETKRKRLVYIHTYVHVYIYIVILYIYILIWSVSYST